MGFSHLCILVLNELIAWTIPQENEPRGREVLFHDALGPTHHFELIQECPQTDSTAGTAGRAGLTLLPVRSAWLFQGERKEMYYQELPCGPSKAARPTSPPGHLGRSIEVRDRCEGASLARDA